MMTTTGADLISSTVFHALDPLIFLLSATRTTVFLTVQYAREDGLETEPVERKFVDSVGLQGVLESGALVSSALTTTTTAIPGRLQLIITGEKGSLKSEASGPFKLTPPTLYQYTLVRRKDGKLSISQAPVLVALVNCMLRLLMGRRHTWILMRRLSGMDGGGY